MSLNLWTIYARPTDYPQSFVARRFQLDKPTNEVIVRDTLEEVRAALPPGLHRMERHPSDDPVIVEVWF